MAKRLSARCFLDILLSRRSRRFGLGMSMPASPLAYQSRHAPCPLREEEEAALAFAATGITGHALADLCYERGQGGNIMNGFVGRAIGSGDAIQSVALFVINDQGAWLVKRPRELSVPERLDLIRLAGAQDFASSYRRSRVQVKSTRCAPPLDPLFNINCNRWSLYAPGTSYFLPVNDLTFLYINGLLEILNETTGAFILDERASFRPAGLASLARRRGGHLHDDPRSGRVATIELVERLVTEFATIEQGMMHQNLALMAEALGLGGFPNFANHEFGWFQALGFRMGQMPASQYLGAGRVATTVLSLLGRNPPLPYPIGLEVQGTPLLRAYCPPYFASMSDAVQAVVAAKQAAFVEAAQRGPWKAFSPEKSSIAVSPAAIQATTNYCEYLWQRYGRFPAYLAPFRTVVGFQACHLDVEFYDRHYQPGTITEAHREDFARATAQVRKGSA